MALFSGTPAVVKSWQQGKKSIHKAPFVDPTDPMIDVAASPLREPRLNAMNPTPKTVTISKTDTNYIHNLESTSSVDSVGFGIQQRFWVPNPCPSARLNFSQPSEQFT
jgi:hypothetical protein